METCFSLAGAEGRLSQSCSGGAEAANVRRSLIFLAERPGEREQSAEGIAAF
jgi:hypothetical protein